MTWCSTQTRSQEAASFTVLEEIGKSYETVWLEYGPKMKASDYLSVNPMGKVPALKDGDIVITETAAICAYLADRFPEKNLAPLTGYPAEPLITNGCFLPQIHSIWLSRQNPWAGKLQKVKIAWSALAIMKTPSMLLRKR